MTSPIVAQPGGTPNRRDLYAVLATTPLPLPTQVIFYDTGSLTGTVDLYLPKNAPGQVDAWATEYTGQPEYGGVVDPGGSRPWRAYKATLAVAGWEAEVRSYVHLDVVPVDEPGGAS
jgi:hypothetical protein